MEREPKAKIIGVCCECEASIEVVGSLILGEIVTCTDCGVELEVTKVDGGHFDAVLAPMEGEDWGE